MLETFADGAEVLPGLRARSAPGHCAGHSALEVADGDGVLLHLGDAIHDRMHVEHPEWDSHYDREAGIALATRTALLAEAEERGAVLIASHIDAPGRIERRDDVAIWREHRRLSAFGSEPASIAAKSRVELLVGAHADAHRGGVAERPQRAHDHALALEPRGEGGAVADVDAEEVGDALERREAALAQAGGEPLAARAASRPGGARPRRPRPGSRARRRAPTASRRTRS